ncbi:MAG TPA: ester cyclase [Bacteroidota bacterium]|nr:ester cyclase [Bacteroidota bacterium]
MTRQRAFAVAGVLLVGLAAMSLESCSNERSGYSSEMQAKIDSMQSVLKTMYADQATLEKNLQTFDTLDYTVFSYQQWVRLHESHSHDIVVNWPDGHHTNGIERHIEDLKAMFVYAPDTRIKQHPIRFGSSTGEWTAVTGVFEGTFTKPMPIGNGKFIQPTGKAFKMPMCTIGHWKDGIMIEESLFWDNQTYMNQIGLGK